MGTTIVVGAGSAGGTVASRIAEQDAGEEVLLIEAGPDYVSREGMPPSLLDPYNPDLVHHDWGQHGYLTASDDSLMPYPRGRLVGGSSAVNGAFAGRAMAADLAEWAAAGNDEWSWDEVLPVYRRVERDLDFPESPEHGSDGPIPIYRIDRAEWSRSALAFERACLDRGFPAAPDWNAQGAHGVSPAPRNQIGDLRASTLLTYISQARSCPNLTIRADTPVRRVLLDGTAAVGVEIDGATGPEQISGDRVILSAGAIKTPQLLMLSGIGPEDQLRCLGIEPRIALDGVGRRLLDHPYVPLVMLPKEQNARYGFLVSLRWGEDHGYDLSVGPTLFAIESLNFNVQTNSESILFFPILLGKPRSAGTMRLRSTDPAEAPELHLNFLGERHDVERFMSGTRFVWELITTPPLGDEIDEILFPDEETVHDDSALEAWVRSVATTAYHAAGTCPMGPPSDPNAVVSQRLSVHGATNLYVADASIMPTLPYGFTNISCYMIGERLADWLTTPG